MKKLLLLAVVATFATQSALAWGTLGHKVIVEIAKRHISEQTKANIAKYMPYDMCDDALWMDYHRKDKPIKYTTAWHVYNVDENYEYDPNPRLAKGDAIHALKVAEYNLRNYREQTDSAVLMNLRMVLHFAGDMHCPTHSYVPGPRAHWACELNGKQMSFHGVYDSMPEMLHPGESVADVATEIDNAKKSEIKRIQSGNLHDWAQDIGSKNAVIYKWNEHNRVVLDPNTVELSRELVNLQMRNAGYRLAYLLDLYFGK